MKLLKDYADKHFTRRQLADGCVRLMKRAILGAREWDGTYRASPMGKDVFSATIRNEFRAKSISLVDLMLTFDVIDEDEARRMHGLVHADLMPNYVKLKRGK